MLKLKCDRHGLWWDSSVLESTSDQIFQTEMASDQTFQTEVTSDQTFQNELTSH